MASTSKHHHELTDGVGKCSVPMWQLGAPAGFCDEPAYGVRPPSATYRNGWTGELKRMDGRYDGYVPGLACPGHGGPPKPLHQGDPCIHCGLPHDEVPVGHCRGAKSSSEAA